MFLGLSMLAPCADEIDGIGKFAIENNTCESSSDEQQAHKHDHNHGDTENCSPFCYCQCCSVVSFFYSETPSFFEEWEEIVLFDQKSTPYSNSYFRDFSEAIFQPPIA
jgi:hypothetical protein